MRPFRSIRSPPCGSVAGRCLLAFLGTISLAHAATPSPFVPPGEVAALGVAPTTRVTRPAAAQLSRALAQLERCDAGKAAIGAVLTDRKGNRTRFAWRLAPDAPAGDLDTRATRNGEPGLAYALAFGRLGIESAEEIWPAADAQGRGVLVGVRADRVIFTLAFDDQGRLDRLDGGRLASKFEWTELPTGLLALSALELGMGRWTFTRKELAGCGLPAVADLRLSSGESVALTEIEAVAIDPPRGRRHFPSGVTGIPFATMYGSFDAASAAEPPAPDLGEEGGVIGGLLGGVRPPGGRGIQATDLGWRTQTAPIAPGWMEAGTEVVCYAGMTLNAQGEPTATARVSGCPGAFAAAYVEALAQWRAEPDGPLAGGLPRVVDFSHRFVGTGPVPGLPFVSPKAGARFSEAAPGLWLEEARPGEACGGAPDAVRRANWLAVGEGLEPALAHDTQRALRRPWVTAGYRLPTQAEGEGLGVDVLTEGETGCQEVRLVRTF